MNVLSKAGLMGKMKCDINFPRLSTTGLTITLFGHKVPGSELCEGPSSGL